MQHSNIISQCPHPTNSNQLVDPILSVYQTHLPTYLYQSSFAKMPEVTDREKVRARIAAGGWFIAWGDLINEGDLIELIVSLGTSTPAVWVLDQVRAQLVKFGQSLEDVSEDVLNQATSILEQVIKHKISGEWEIDGLGIKAGIATYHRWWQITFQGQVISSTPLPNNYQPYIGIRVVKPLPPKGSKAKQAVGMSAAGANALNRATLELPTVDPVDE